MRNLSFLIIIITGFLFSSFGFGNKIQITSGLHSVDNIRSKNIISVTSIDSASIVVVF